MSEGGPHGESIGYEFDREQDARELASELDRRFDKHTLTGLRVHRVVWNGSFIVEAVFSTRAREGDLTAARALLGEAGTPVHPDDLEDYKKATRSGFGGRFRRFFGL